jgi:nucleotidyltransferase/DNA polymerase involved in DNA repair
LLAKIASDSRKPDGLFVIQPEEVDAFLQPLPVGRLPGVGRVTEEKLTKLGTKTVFDCQSETLNLMLGLAGVGQALIRFAMPSEVPSVSMLESLS